MKKWPAGAVTLATDALRECVSGKRIALMVNSTATDNAGQMLIDSIPRDWDTEVLFFFGMEHGVRGNIYAADRNIGTTDDKTGLRIVNLYEYAGLRPPVEWIAKVDAVVFCAQDTGVRHWTYTPWLMCLMDETAKTGREVIVLDRPNPIRGDIVEGALTEKKYAGQALLSGFCYPLRHGMTIGEIALMYNDTCHIGCNLTVLPMEGWRRNMWYNETGLMWMPPSPNMPTTDSPLYFATTGLLQSSNISLGWSTTTPFQYFGAPWLDGDMITERLNSLELPGVFFVQKYYQASLGHNAPELCNGVFITVHDRNLFRPVTAQLYIMDLLSSEIDFDMERDKSLCCVRMGTDELRNAWNNATPISSFVSKWEQEASEFERTRAPYLLY